MPTAGRRAMPPKSANINPMPKKFHRRSDFLWTVLDDAELVISVRNDRRTDRVLDTITELTRRTGARKSTYAPSAVPPSLKSVSRRCGVGGGGGDKLSKCADSDATVDERRRLSRLGGGGSGESSVVETVSDAIKTTLRPQQATHPTFCGKLFYI